MRITGGEVRGLRLATPRSTRVRPTSDQVRSAMFQILGQSVADARVLDLYAGTGALGLEALSRGAARVDFVEQDSRLCRFIERNLENARFATRGQVYPVLVEQALKFLKGPYHLVLLDPPYDMPGMPMIVEALNSPGLIDEEGMVVIEHSRRVALADRYGALRRGGLRRYGDTALSLYSIEEA